MVITRSPHRGPNELTLDDTRLAASPHPRNPGEEAAPRLPGSNPFKGGGGVFRFTGNSPLTVWTRRELLVTMGEPAAEESCLVQHDLHPARAHPMNLRTRARALAAALFTMIALAAALPMML